MKKLIAALLIAFYIIPVFAGMSSGAFTLPTGTNGQVLTYDDTQPRNVKFADASSGGGAQDLAGFTRQMLLEDYTATQEQTFAELPSDASEGSWNSAVANITEGDSMSAASNILTVDTTSASTASSAYYLAPDIDFNAGFTYEITAAITTSATADGRCLLGFVRDGTQGESFSLNANTTSVIVTGAAAVTVTLDTTASHTYRIAVLATTWKLFIDDVFRAQGTIKSDAGSDDVRFGDISTTADANSNFSISALSYVLGTSASNYDKFHLTADTIYVGSTKLTSIDETINLTEDLDTGSAATGTIYNIELLSDGTLQFTTDTATDGRFVGGVKTDATTATRFLKTYWAGSVCYIDTEYTGCVIYDESSLTSGTEYNTSLSSWLPASACEVTLVVTYQVGSTQQGSLGLSANTGEVHKYLQGYGTQWTYEATVAPKSTLYFKPITMSGTARVAFRLYSYKERL